ncbi:hypothetical protein E2562_028036 [Oryza meyeriana var. granulata]|uniref:PB1 domain-containing protein n=1 Tax=Oryza meyeriana var. granulata TaxID=110450 RepID=A0A6G1C0C2_9ORYZ|nr:hypothetical protein E2562_028036 [Oryza meyeriana var. granulata]
MLTVTLLDAHLARCSSVRHLLQIHAQFVASGLLADAFAASRLLLFTATTRLLPLPFHHSLRLLCLVHRPNAFSCNTVLKAARDHGLPHLCLPLYGSMPAAPDGYTHPILAAACATRGAIHEGHQVHCHAVRHGFGRNLYLTNSLMSMYSACGCLGDARRVFDAGPMWDAVSWNTILAAYVQAGDVHQAVGVFAQMPEWSAAAVSSMVALFGRRGMVDEARRVFDRAEHKDVFTWTAMISCFQRNGMFAQALGLFSDMRGEGWPVDEAVMVSVVAACARLEVTQSGEMCHGLAVRAGLGSRLNVQNALLHIHAGLVEEGQHFFKLMQCKYHIVPNIRHYGCMVDLLGRAGYVREAEDLIESMPMPPDVPAWGALLGSCWKHGDNEVGERVGRKLVSLDPRHDGFHTMLSNIYASEGMWQCVKDLRGSMKQRHVPKVPGKFRHLPVVEHGEVIAMLDITKFLYDAISRMEKAAEQGSAIAAAMEGVERQWGNDFPGPHAFIENLRDQLFKPSLSTIITENSSVPVVFSSDPVIVSAKKMKEYRANSVVVMTGNMLLGILTSKDLVLRVVAQSLSPDVTLVEKVMTTSPDCATLDTSILEALHSMQDGKFLHIPVADKNGQIIACLDALQLTHAAISMVEGASEANNMANSMMQKFWDSALALQPAEESDARSEESRMATLDNAEGKHIPPHVGNSFSFKLQDIKGCMLRFSCVSESLDELVSAVSYRLGMENEKARINLLYDDDEGDRVVLTTDDDLSAAIQHARSAGWKVLRLHMDEPWSSAEHTTSLVDTSPAETARPFLRLGIAAGAVALASVGVIFYLKRSEL